MIPADRNGSRSPLVPPPRAQGYRQPARPVDPDPSGRLTAVRAMSRVERFFERLVERPSARLFRTRLQPLQILRRIERTMDAERGGDGRQVLVPDQFTVRIHPDDLAALDRAEIGCSTGIRVRHVPILTGAQGSVLMKSDAPTVDAGTIRKSWSVCVPRRTSAAGERSAPVP